MRRTKRIVLGAFVIVSLASCMTAQQHKAAVQSDEGEKLTVGTVQREIRVGMSGGEVAAALGSPNIVSTDENGREVWIYDKIATDRVFSKSSGGTGGLLSLILVGLDVSAGASSTSQRTLTIIIKFDDQSKVRDFAYHSSKF